MPLMFGQVFEFLDGIQRPLRIAVNVVLAIILGLLVAQIFWFLVAPSAAGSSKFAADLPIPIAETKSSIIVDRTVLFKSNYFETSGAVILVEDDAPETKLNLTLEGVIAPSASGDASGGSAYIRLSDKAGKRFAPGDIVADGAELLRVEQDRVLLSRDGVTEVLLLRGPGKKTIVTWQDGDELPATEAVVEDRLETFSAFGSREKFFAAVSADPISREDGDYLVLSPKSSQEEFESLQFKTGDILLEAEGIAGTDFNKLGELITQNDEISVTIERAGKPVEINIRFVQ